MDRIKTRPYIHLPSSGAPVFQQTRFAGKEPEPEKSTEPAPEKAETKFADLYTKKDPRPKYGLHNLKNLAIMALSFVGFWYGDAAVNRFHQWSDQRVSQKQVRKLDEDPIFPGIPALDPEEIALDTLAQADHTIHHTRFVSYMQDLYVDLLRWEALTIGLLAGISASRRAITPSKLYGELLKRGVSGKGLKVAVICTSDKPKEKLPENQMTVITPDNEGTGLSLIMPGNQLINLIAEASPDSTFMVCPAITRANAKKIFKEANEIFHRAKSDPESLDIREIRRVYEPIIQNIANGVKRAVDDGANVIHISFNLEQLALIYLFYRLARTYMDLGMLKLKRQFLKKGSELEKANLSTQERYSRLLKLSRGMVKEHKQTQSIGEDFKQLYSPLKEALDYAYSREIPVVVASGNYGGHEGTKPDVIGNVNPLTIINHPGLIVVGSTEADGNVSETTSEYNDEIRPFIGGLGSETVIPKSTSVLKRAWGQKFLFPLGSVFFNYVRGASLAVFSRPLWSQIMGPSSNIATRMLLGESSGGEFAAPDVTLLFLKMKEIDPSLTIEEAKVLILQASQKATLSPKFKKKLTKEIETLGKPPIRNYAQSFVDNCISGIHTALRVDKKNIRIPSELGAIKLTQTKDIVRIRFKSNLDQERVYIELSKEGLRHLDDKTFLPLWDWLKAIMQNENNKLATLTQEAKMAKALEMELGRRIGNGTIVNSRHKILAMTEQVRIMKEQNAQNPEDVAANIGNEAIIRPDEAIKPDVITNKILPLLLQARASTAEVNAAPK